MEGKSESQPLNQHSIQPISQPASHSASQPNQSVMIMTTTVLFNELLPLWPSTIDYDELHTWWCVCEGGGGNAVCRGRQKGGGLERMKGGG